MAEDIIGQLQEIGVRGYQADMASLLPGVAFGLLFVFPAVVEPGHGILFRQGLQGVLLLLVLKLLALQGADRVFQLEIAVGQLGELVRQQGQGVQDMAELFLRDHRDGMDMFQEHLFVQLQHMGIDAVLLFIRDVFRQPHLTHQHAGQVLSLHHDADAGVRQPGGLAVADIRRIRSGRSRPGRKVRNGRSPQGTSSRCRGRSCNNRCLWCSARRGGRGC